MRIAPDRLIEKVQSLGIALPTTRHAQGAQIEVVGGEIVGRAVGRTGGFGRLQCRLDDAGDTDATLS